MRCVRGSIFDVAVDLRRDSETFGQWEGFVLDDESHRQLFVPVGFGHGFCVLSELADVSYLLTSVYDPETESGIAWDDPQVGIEWPLPDGEEPLLSERDRAAPSFRRGGAFLALLIRGSSSEAPSPRTIARGVRRRIARSPVIETLSR